MRTPALSALILIASAAPASAAPWNFRCTGKSQFFHGVQYTKVTGSLLIDLAASKVSYEATEETLPPFDYDKWSLGNAAPDTPIAQFTETSLPKDPGNVELTLRINRPLDERTSENYTLVKLDAPANYREIPPASASVGIMSSMTFDSGDRGPEWETSWSYLVVECVLK